MALILTLKQIEGDRRLVHLTAAGQLRDSHEKIHQARKLSSAVHSRSPSFGITRLRGTLTKTPLESTRAKSVECSSALADPRRPQTRSMVVGNDRLLNKTAPVRHKSCVFLGPLTHQVKHKMSHADWSLVPESV